MAVAGRRRQREQAESRTTIGRGEASPSHDLVLSHVQHPRRFRSGGSPCYQRQWAAGLRCFVGKLAESADIDEGPDWTEGILAMYRNVLLLFVALMTAAGTTGCALCCKPDDYGSHYYGGAVGDRIDDCHRVGSAYAGTSHEE